MNSSWLDRNRHVVFVTLLLVALGSAGVLYWRQPAKESSIEVIPPQETTGHTPAATSPTSTPAFVRVYVTGAILNSDVYVLPKGSIVKDVIVAAGGFTEDADRERINQALELKDQQQIHVPRFGETDAPLLAPGEESGHSEESDTAPAAVGGLININTATVEELDGLPGVGPAIARRIIDYREQVGGFKSIEQITEVNGIGDAMFDKIEGLITVGE